MWEQGCESANGQILSLSWGGQFPRLVRDRGRTDWRWLCGRERTHEGLCVVKEFDEVGNSKVGGEEVGNGRRA